MGYERFTVFYYKSQEFSIFEIVHIQTICSFTDSTILQCHNSVKLRIYAKILKLKTIFIKLVNGNVIILRHFSFLKKNIT